MQVEFVLRPLIEFERAISELYGRWAEVFEADREASLLFTKMATEENGHANLVEYHRRLLQKNPNLSGSVDVTQEEMATLLGIVRQSLAGPPPGLEEAVRLACVLEASASDGELRIALKGSHPDVRSLLDLLGNEDRQHVERLIAFARKRRIAVRPTQPG
jgi:rubrerythrin